jgi:hypothetical protein
VLQHGHIDRALKEQQTLLEQRRGPFSYERNGTVTRATPRPLGSSEFCRVGGWQVVVAVGDADEVQGLGFRF